MIIYSSREVNRIVLNEGLREVGRENDLRRVKRDKLEGGSSGQKHLAEALE